jgi:hypothetical protein
MKFRFVFWDVLPCKIIVPEDKSEPTDFFTLLSVYKNCIINKVHIVDNVVSFSVSLHSR